MEQRVLVIEELVALKAAHARLRRWTAVGFVVLGLALAALAALLLWARESAPPGVDTQGVVVRDVAGRVRAVLDAASGEPSLRLLDAGGVVRLEARLHEQRASLKLFGDGPAASAALFTFEDGAGITLTHAGRPPVAAVNVRDRGAGLLLTDDQGTPVFSRP